MSTDESIQQVLIKCSRLKTRDYRDRTRTSICNLEHLVSSLEKGKLAVCHPLQPLTNIIQTVVLSIDRTTLWKLRGKVNEHQQQLARIVCRLFKCLCQIDAESAVSDQGQIIIHSILQWLRDNTNLHVTKAIQ